MWYTSFSPSRYWRCSGSGCDEAAWTPTMDGQTHTSRLSANTSVFNGRLLECVGDGCGGFRIVFIAVSPPAGREPPAPRRVASPCPLSLIRRQEVRCEGASGRWSAQTE